MIYYFLHLLNSLVFHNGDIWSILVEIKSSLTGNVCKNAWRNLLYLDIILLVVAIFVLCLLINIVIDLCLTWIL